MNENEVMYVGQKAFIQKGDELLVLWDNASRIDYPGGRIQVGEDDFVESLKREVMEETGLEINVGKPFSTFIHTFGDNHQLAGKKIFIVNYKCEYVSGEVKLSDEHTKYFWVNKNNFNDFDNTTPFFNILKKYYNDY